MATNPAASPPKLNCRTVASFFIMAPPIYDATQATPLTPVDCVLVGCVLVACAMLFAAVARRIVNS